MADWLNWMVSEWMNGPIEPAPWEREVCGHLIWKKQKLRRLHPSPKNQPNHNKKRNRCNQYWIIRSHARLDLWAFNGGVNHLVNNFWRKQLISELSVQCVIYHSNWYRHNSLLNHWLREKTDIFCNQLTDVLTFHQIL